MTDSPIAAGSFELVAGGFSFPTSLTFDAQGRPCLAEAGLPFGGAPPGGRVLRLEGDRQEVLVDGLRPPVNGLTFHQEGLYISEGGNPSRISRLEPDGSRVTLLEGLPGPGNYHLNMVTFGPDGLMYFSQGAMTNLGIVGLDAYELGWLRRLPHAHDIPGSEVELRGVNVETANPLSPEPGARASTGAFVPFGTPTSPGQRVPAEVPCTAAVMRCDPKGAGLELVAWGLRNAYGLGFLDDGRLLAIDQGADDRGSRPVGNAPDVLFEVRPGAWYGWPDFIDGDPVTAPRFIPERGLPPEFVLANHGQLPPPEKPLYAFPPHCAATRFAVPPAGAGSLKGQLFVTLFGDEAPMTAPRGRAGRSLARLDLQAGTLQELAGSPLHRPIDLRFDPAGEHLYVLDFGEFEMSERGVVATARSGALWRLPVSALS